jgi:succinate---hydroxymethylglutarate CoA-transferase
MLDCLLATSALQTSEYWGTGENPKPLGTRHSRNAPYQVFMAKDASFALAAGNDRLWTAVCDVLEVPALARDERFQTQTDRVDNQIILETLLTQHFKERTAAHWVGAFRERGVPAGPVNTYGDILTELTDRGHQLVQEMSIPVIGCSFTTVFPVRVTGEPARLDLSPPRLGEQTDAVFAEWL